MAVGLVLISFLALLLVFWQGTPAGAGLRSAFLQTAVVHGVAIALLTEGLSPGRLLSAPLVILEWFLLALINCSLLALLIRSGRLQFSPAPLTELWQRVQAQNRWHQVWILGIITILLICLVTALIAPPNNWDSMSYHMPRVMHWIQNRTLAHYPTHNLRQISFSGGASYIVLHLQLLSGGDRFANCVQWLAFLGCILGTSLITRTLGNPAMQVLTATLCGSILMAIMQSTTPQNDLVVSFWLISCAYFIVRTERYHRFDWLWIAAAWGLAVLTKPTAFIFGGPLLILLAIRLVSGSQNPARDLLRSAGITIGVTLMGLGLSLPSYGRNLATFGSFLGIDTDTRNVYLGLSPLISNLLRNVAVLIPFPPVFALANALLLGLGLDPNDPNTTFTFTPFDVTALNWRNLFMPDEDVVASPIHAILTLSSIVVLMGTALNRRRRSALWPFAASVLLGFCLFSLLLRWQIWHNRLLLPFLILSTPLVSQVMGQWHYRLARLVASTVLLLALVYSLVPMHRPLIALPESWTNITQSPSILSLSREELLFSTYIKRLREPYIRFTQDLLERDRCQALGLVIDVDDWEYPIWVLLQARTPTPVWIRHEAVENVSRKLPPEFPDQELCGVFEKRKDQLRYFKRTHSNSSSL